MDETHLDEVEVFLVEEELHGLVGALVAAGLCALDVSTSWRLGRVKHAASVRDRPTVVQVEEAPGLLIVRGGGCRDAHLVVDGGVGDLGCVEVGLEQADGALGASLHRASFRHLDGCRASKIGGGASARPNPKGWPRAQRPRSRWLRR